MPRKKQTVKFYALFGFLKSNPETTGYFSKTNTITTNLIDAKLFPSKNYKRIKGFAKPEVWEEFINNDKTLNSGFKFHLIGVKNFS